MMLTLLLISIITLTFNVQTVKSEPKTWTVDDDGPADFHTIQEAVDVASDGDTVFVYEGTYSENIIVNKGISLLGEDKYTTIIDAPERFGRGIHVSSTSNVTISEFTIRHRGMHFPDECGGL